MKLRQILFLLVVGGLGVVASGAAQITNNEDSVDMKVYFPMEGKWTYQVTEFSNTWQGVRTISGPVTRPSGEVYLEKMVGPVSTQLTYYKVAAGLYMAGKIVPNWPDIEYTPPIVIFLDNFVPGMTYKRSFVMASVGMGAGYLVSMAREEAPVVVPAGTYRGCYRSERWLESDVNDRQVYWFAPGVGMVKMVRSTKIFTNSMVLVSYQGTNRLPGVRRLLGADDK